MTKPALLCVVAHPDDETRLCGGTLALLAQRGVAVHVMCLTRGEGGELGEPPLATRATLGAVREQELVRAVRALGGRSLTFLDYVDPTVGPDGQLSAPEHDPVVLAGQIMNSIRQFDVQVVLGHGSNGEYGHPAHLAAHQATLTAIAALSEHSPEFYTVSAWFPEHPHPRLANPDDLADLVLDVRPVMERKINASLCHETQCALFVRRRTAELGRPVTVAEVITTETHEGLRWWGRGATGAGDNLIATWL